MTSQVNITINNQEVQVDQGTTLLQAARSMGIEVPTMCYLNGNAPFNSCMVCVMEDVKLNRLVPSCSAVTYEGMVVETDSSKVFDARQSTLELLLSEHVGDCEAPCQRLCPSHLNIPKMIREIDALDYKGAMETIRKDLPIPSVISRSCPAPCEKGCRRGKYDKPVSICLLTRFVADWDRRQDTRILPEIKEKSGKMITIVGSGATALSAAYFLIMQGHGVTIIEAEDQLGGKLRQSDDIPDDALDEELALLETMGAAFRAGTSLGTDHSLDELQAQADAVILAIGINPPDDLGVTVAKAGIKVSKTLETSVKGVFAAGTCTKNRLTVIKTIAMGKELSVCVHQFLSDNAVKGSHDLFNSKMGRLLDGEIDDFVLSSDERPRVDVELNPASQFTPDEAGEESTRCLHCDCRAQSSCLLREYSEAYEVKQQRFRVGDREVFVRRDEGSNVVFEHGKCIKCGLCVQITKKEEEPLGLAFLDRGFNLKVNVPFGEELQQGMTETAMDVVSNCPTGALAFFHDDDHEEARCGNGGFNRIQKSAWHV